MIHRPPVCCPTYKVRCVESVISHSSTFILPLCNQTLTHFSPELASYQGLASSLTYSNTTTSALPPLALHLQPFLSTHSISLQPTFKLLFIFYIIMASNTPTSSRYSNTSTNLTDKEIRVLGLAWRCMETKPKVSFDFVYPLSFHAFNLPSITTSKACPLPQCLPKNIHASSPSSSSA